MEWLARLAADGHSAYVAGAFAFTFAVLAAEVLVLRRRWRALQDRTP
jgi:hypothetical protein